MCLPSGTAASPGLFRLPSPRAINTADQVAVLRLRGRLRRTRGNSYLPPVQRAEGTPPALRPQNPFDPPSALLPREVESEFRPARGDAASATPRRAVEQEHLHVTPPPTGSSPRKQTRIPACSAAPSPVKPTTRRIPRLPASLPWGLPERWGPWWPAHPSGKAVSYKEPHSHQPRYKTVRGDERAFEK